MVHGITLQANRNKYTPQGIQTAPVCLPCGVRFMQCLTALYGVAFSKKEQRKGDDRAAVILYGKEASALIMLLTVYISAVSDSEPHDFFSELGKNRKGEIV